MSGGTAVEAVVCVLQPEKMSEIINLALKRLGQARHFPCNQVSRAQGLLIADSGLPVKHCALFAQFTRSNVLESRAVTGQLARSKSQRVSGSGRSERPAAAARA